MEVTLNPKNFGGKITAPASKSYLQRAIAIAAFAKGKTKIEGYTSSKDSDAALDIIRQLGAKVETKGSSIEIEAIEDLNTDNLNIHCGESGLGSRMFIPLVSQFSQTISITGEGSLLTRPLDMVENALIQLGKKVKSNNGYLPFEISGKVKNHHLQIDGSETSQLLTGLLILMPLLSKDSVIKVNNLKSKPYIQMTLDILKEFEIEIENRNFKVFKIRGNQKLQARDYKVESDWSGAAFWIVAGAIKGNVEIEGLNPHSSQADKAILDALLMSGVRYFWKDGKILTVEKSELKAFEFDATDCPDLFPPLACLAANANGISKIKGVHRLTHKESNRTQSIISEFGKIGIQIHVVGDEMLIEGKPFNRGGITDSHNDHRIAMAMAIMSLTAQNPITITQAQAVNKSYPKFWADFSRLSHQ